MQTFAQRMQQFASTEQHYYSGVFGSGDTLAYFTSQALKTTLSPSQMQVQAANVLFVDNPVGTGYSYCDTDDAFTSNVDEIAKDLVTLFSAFLKDIPVFQVSLNKSYFRLHARYNYTVCGRLMPMS